MPISKLNYSLSGYSATAGDNELPEADRYGSKFTYSYATNGDQDDGFEPEKSKRPAVDGVSSETFIEREIREQRERERELANMRNWVFQQAPSMSESNDSLPQAQTTSAAYAAEAHVDWNGGHVPAVDDEIDRGLTATKTLKQEAADVPPKRNDDVNPGENLIFRELLEQQRREEELRQHWREMGINLLQYHSDEDDENNDFVRNDVIDSGDRAREFRSDDASAVHDRKTATVTRSGGQQQSNHVAATTAAEARRAPEARVDVLPPPIPSTPPPSREHRREITVDIAAANRGKVSVDALPTETPSKSIRKVLPLPDDHESMVDGDVALLPLTATLFAPTNETLMEREFRASREREEALRLLRGLPHNAQDEERRRSQAVEIEVEVKVKTDRPLRRSRSDATDGLLMSASGGQSTGDRRQWQQQTSMSASVTDEEKDDNLFSKRFAESRLKAELQRQRQRELDLRRSGLINTISDERAGDPMKYVEVMVTPSGPTTNASTSVKRQASSPSDVLLRESKAAGAAEADKSEIDGGTATLIKTTSPENVAAVKATTATPTTTTAKVTKPAATPSPIPASETPRREIPPVLRTYSYPAASEDVVVSETKSTSKLSPEARILEEVAECKRRDEELRMLREILRLHQPTGSSISWEPSEPSVSVHAASTVTADSFDSRPTILDRHDEDGFARAPDNDDFLGQSRESQEVTSPRGGARRRLALIDEWERMSFAANSSQP